MVKRIPGEDLFSCKILNNREPDGNKFFLRFVR